MVPILRERAAATDLDRRISPETVSEFTKAGFFKVLQPHSSGGLGLDVPTFLRVVSILGSGCTSSAWVVSLLAVHNWAVGLWSAAAQSEVFGSSGDARVAMILRPEGTATEVPGGVRLTGQWPFATGIDFATHVAVGASGVASSGPASGPLLALITPVETMQVIDDWYVLGMRGTGSKSVWCKDLFIPSHMVRKMRLDESSDYPQRYAATLRTSLFTLSLAAPVLGAVKHAIDIRFQTLSERRPSTGSVKNGPRHIRWSQANALHGTASIVLEDVAARFWGQTLRRDEISAENASDLRLHCADVMRMCVQAVDLLMNGASTREFFDHSPMQRLFRDVHMAVAHEATNADAAELDYARFHFGQPDSPASLG